MPVVIFFNFTFCTFISKLSLCMDMRTTDLPVLMFLQWSVIPLEHITKHWSIIHDLFTAIITNNSIIMCQSRWLSYYLENS